MAFLEMKHIRKTFGATVANDDVNLSVERGEIHALLGENGAGKSTLMNILYGMYPADSGEITLDGKPLRLNGSRDAIARGIGIGSASHAVGTAKAMELGQVEGAMSGLSIAVSGLLTVAAAAVFSMLH